MIDFMIRSTLGVALVIVSLILAAPAAAQTYRWVDETGAVHYSEGLDSVPERFRAGARRLLLPAAPARAPTAPAAGEGADTVIEFEPGKRIYATARINGSQTARLIVDTGADRTVIAPRTLVAAGVSLRAAGAAGQIRGATGTADVQAYDIESLQVGNARVGKMLVISHDIDIPDADGLLGRDFLDRFNVTIDNGAGKVTLGPK
jgi:predicted aspartyl protease